MNKKFLRSIILGLVLVTIFTRLSLAGNVNDIYGGPEKVISEKIPMNIDHQRHLYNLCVDRNIDYIKALALVQTESSFQPSVVSRGNYGYMQLNRINHKRLSQTLGTANGPLDPYINLNWGSFMLAELYRKFEAKGLRGDKLDRAVWSSYNKGEAGYRRTGEASHYINKNYRHINYVRETLGLNKK